MKVHYETAQKLVDNLPENLYMGEDVDKLVAQLRTKLSDAITKLTTSDTLQSVNFMVSVTKDKPNERNTV